MPKVRAAGRTMVAGNIRQVTVAATKAGRAVPTRTGATKTTKRMTNMASTSNSRLVKTASLFILTVAALLSAGCSAIPGLRSPAPIEITGDNIDAVIGSARQLRAEYTRNVTVLSKDIEDSAKFKLIDGTALAAASLFGGNRNVLSFFGIAGGASIAVDGTFSPSVQLGTYESGHSAISCMVDLALTQKSTEPILQRFSSGRTAMKERTANSLQIVNIAAVPETDEKAAEPEKIDTQKDVKNALFSLFQKADQIVGLSETVDLVEIFKTNLVTLDQSVRKKIRSALKPPEANGLRDQLIAQAVEAQSKKDQAKQVETSIQAINQSQGNSFRELNSLAGVLVAAANKATFDTDLKKCAANVGL